MKSLVESILGSNKAGIINVIVDKIRNKEKLDNGEISYLEKSIAIWKPKDRIELKSIIKNYTKLSSNTCSLNWIDVSYITNMSSMFSYSKFNGDISKWDVSNVTDMGYMFGKSKFNQDISKWDVSKVENMDAMFFNCSGLTSIDISKFNTDKVKNMNSMFSGCSKLISIDVSKNDENKFKILLNEKVKLNLK